MPQGLDHRRRFLRGSTPALTARLVPNLCSPARIGHGFRASADAARGNAWMRTPLAQARRFDAPTRDGNLPVALLDRICGKRYALYGPFESGAPASG